MIFTKNLTNSNIIINMRIFLLAIFIIIFIGIVDAYTVISLDTCICDSCLDCSDALNSNDCNIIKLEKDINIINESCIKNPYNFNEKTFDCQGKKVEGSNSMETYGIYLENKKGNVIKNCIISNFYDGIYLSRSINNKIIENDVINNKRNGIYLSNSYNNFLSFNVIKENSVGINLGDSKNNSLIKNIVGGNKLDGFAISFSANNSIIENRIFENNIGIFMDMSSENEILNNSIFSNIISGIYLFHNSSYNLILNNEISNNTKFGIAISNCYYTGDYCLEGCENNIVEENEILNNRIGIYSNLSISKIKSNIVCKNIEADLNSSNWFYSSGTNNTCDIKINWNDEGKDGCSKLCEEMKDINTWGYKEIAIFIAVFLILLILLLKFFNRFFGKFNFK